MYFVSVDFQLNIKHDPSTLLGCDAYFKVIETPACFSYDARSSDIK